MMDKDVSQEQKRGAKSRATQQRLADVGLRLFLHNGFEATTLDMIAEAAQVSRRTFFHYFDSKEAILSSWVANLDDLVRLAVANEPVDATPLQAVRAAVVALASRYETGEALAIDRLMRSTEALRARKQANYERQERFLASALAERWSETDRESPLRLIAMAGIGALRIAIERWVGEYQRGQLTDYVDEALDALTREFIANNSSFQRVDSGRAVDRNARGIG